ncbi:MAG TPA: hypothetical protein VF158_00890 [Longimicrobiales bacterium]
METGAERLAARREWLAQAARAEAEKPGTGAQRVLREHDELMAAQGRPPYYFASDATAVEVAVSVVKNLAHGPTGAAEPLTEPQRRYALQMRAEHYRPSDIADALGVPQTAVTDYLAELGVSTPAHAMDLLKRRAT